MGHNGNSQDGRMKVPLEVRSLRVPVSSFVGSHLTHFLSLGSLVVPQARRFCRRVSPLSLLFRPARVAVRPEGRKGDRE